MLVQEKIDWKEETQRIAENIRRRVFGYVMKNNGGYLSQACSSAEIFALLYNKVMNLGPSEAPLIPQEFMGVPSLHNPNFFNGGAYNGSKAPHLDRFIFSPAHYALVLYTTLIEMGRLVEKGLDHFNRDGSTVEMIGAEHSPGVETTTGSLSQAISQAAGIALARRLKGDTGRVWVLMTDGEFQEGQTWEAVATMVHYQLDNIGIYVDVNGQQCDGKMGNVINLEPLAQKLNAFGARAVDVDGHDLEALFAPSQWAPQGRPLFVLARTNPTQGIPILEERRPLLHYLRFSSSKERDRYQAYYDAMVKED